MIRVSIISMLMVRVIDGWCVRAAVVLSPVVSRFAVQFATAAFAALALVLLLVSIGSKGLDKAVVDHC